MGGADGGGAGMGVVAGAGEIPAKGRFRAALILAMLADLVQLFVWPLFVEGAGSPADDALDLGVGAAMFALLGWHWEFLPSFAAKLVPGVDLVPLWTLAVANVYRKAKQLGQGAGSGESNDRE